MDQHAVGMTVLERLEAIEDIKLLKGRRDRLVDTQEWEALEALHAPDYHGYNGDYPPFTSAAEMIASVKVIMKDLRTAHHSTRRRSPSTRPPRRAGSGA